MTEQTNHRLRLLALLACFLVLASAAVIRLSYWQLGQGPQLRAVAASQQTAPDAELPLRGEIRDRHGTVLARTAYLDLLAAFPDQLDDSERDRLAEALTAILELDAERAGRLRESLAPDDPYAVLARSLTQEQSEQIRAAMLLPTDEGGLRGLALEPRPVRTYPLPGGAPGTTLASQLLGFVTEDGKGHYGIEGYHDETLAAGPSQVASTDASNGALAARSGGPGSDLTLTIDASLQLRLERELYAAWVADGAKRVSAVVLDPGSGEVLAWASVPGYDANQFASVAADRPELLVDPIATSVYEPGSVMKMMTAAAALEAGTITLDQEVQDGYGLRFGSTEIHNADRSSRGRLPFQDAIAYSRNVATARVALDMDRTVMGAARKLYDTWTAFGFGQPTGIDLASEGVGLVSDPDKKDWQPIDLANRAFGQGVAVTQAQLAVAFAAMANGGLRVTPHLVAPDPAVVGAVAEPSRAVDESRAAELRGLLQHVTQRVPWYRDATQIPGYTVGGKTGTAQIWDPVNDRWLTDRYNFTFAGFVGAAEPAAVIVTRIEEGQPTQHADYLDLGVESYELFHRIAVHTIAALDVPPLSPPSLMPPAPPGEAGDRGDRRGRTRDQPDPGG